jgi:2-amino-4-hydroxy-6-hydroxymethyldihydropteridine diphosphokinase
MQSEKPVYLLLGSNLGDRLRVMHAASDMLEKTVGKITAMSSVYETAPWGVLEQPSFLNQVLELHTTLTPEEILRLVLEIEHELGRVRYERWGARVIDIDILFFSSEVLDTARLTVPHPRLHERRFTMIPLVEIIPFFMHPVLKKSLSELLTECEDASEVHLFSGDH